MWIRRSVAVKWHVNDEIFSMSYPPLLRLLRGSTREASGKHGRRLRSAPAGQRNKARDKHNKKSVAPLVRDEGVAGSNPATPTNFLVIATRYGARYGERNSISLPAAA
jgi:hypothetical protein